MPCAQAEVVRGPPLGYRYRTFKSSTDINNRHNHTAAYRMCSGGQQRWKGVGGDDGEQASKQACLTERFHLEATRRKVLTYVPSAKK